MMRYIIGFLGIVAVLILIIVLIVRGGSRTGTPQAIDLADYATSSSQAVLTIDGPAAASENHNSIRISVDQSRATVEVIQGYEGQIIKTNSFPMNPSAYTNFLLALKHTGYTLGVITENLKDERGYCPTGDRYIYELRDNNNQILRYWNTSCSNKQGTFKGQGSLIRQLYQAQIPGYSNITSGARL